MATKLIQTIKDQGAGRVAKVYRDTDWDEFQVRYTLDGKALPKATYHTDDRMDAVLTASHWVRGTAVAGGIH